MNREYEFKAWLKKEKKMVDVREINFADEQISFETDDDILYAFFDEIELIPYIGLKDINGVKIFDGDIVESQLGIKYKVCFFESSGAFGAITNYPYNDHKWFDDFSNMCVINNQETYKNLEVIGNVWENKELLENE